VLHSKPGASGDTRQVIVAIFAPTGEYWVIGYPGHTFSLKGSKGLSYIHRLLQRPGEEFHALDLLGSPGVGQIPENETMSGEWTKTFRVAGVGDSGEMLDGRAKHEYQRKLIELRQDLEDARELGNSERRAQLESEIDFLARELSRGVGLGGRDRRAGSAAERARLNVTRTIKSAIDKIAEYHSELAQQLSRYIRTGLFCSYLPDSSSQVGWKFLLAGDSSQPVESGGPVLRRSESAFAQALAGRTAFVGRESECAALERILEQTRGGRGQLMMISGPPGVGKTRMTAEFCNRACEQGAIAFPGGCSDREDPAPFLPFVEILESALASSTNPKTFRDALGDEASEIARLMPQLRRMFEDIPPPLEVQPEQSRRLLLSSFTRVIERATLNQPVILVLEDLQWADEGTLSLLDHLARSAPKMRLMMIGTFREGELNPANSLGDTLGGLTRLQLLERISLRGLSEEAVSDMVAALSGQQPPTSLVSLFYSNTEGNPFFVEELFKHFVERGKLFAANGDFRETFDFGDLDVPGSVRLVVDRRLARLSVGTRNALGTAAVVEGAFTFEILQAASGVDADALLDSMDEAEGAGLISSALQYPVARFKFAHELIRRTLLDGYSAARRQRLHLKVADAIERLHKNALADHAEDLAHHLWHAGVAADPERTIRFLKVAGEQAFHRSAMTQAARHFRAGLELISTLPEGTERLQQELSLQTNLGSTLVATKGFSSLEVGRVFARARELSHSAGQSPQLFQILWGQWINYASRSEHGTARELAEQCLRLAEDAGDAALLIEAHHALGVSWINEVDFVKALDHLDRAIALYDPQQHASNAYTYGQDPAAICHIHAAHALWSLGYYDQALKRINEGLDIGRKLAHPRNLATIGTFAGLIQQFFRNASAVVELVEPALKISSEYNFAFTKAMGTILGGWALTQLRSRDEGVARMQEGLEIFRSIDAVHMTPYFSSLLAEAYGDAGRPEQGLDLFADLNAAGEPFWEAELHRVKGELILRRGTLQNLKRDGESAAETCFRQALAIAQRQKAKSFELRAAMSLGRLLILQGRSSEAYNLMTDIFGWFTEGFDTLDLCEAKALIEELRKKRVADL
jgi:tetratricopeptide (TPR) repeat protein